jgi:hypothetical protein
MMLKIVSRKAAKKISRYENSLLFIFTSYVALREINDD